MNAAKQRASALKKATKQKPVGVCEKCGVNRFKHGCPYRYSSPVNCPMVGDAKGPQ